MGLLGCGEKGHQALCTPHPIPFSLGVLGAPSERSLGQGTELRCTSRGLCPISAFEVVGIPPYVALSPSISPELPSQEILGKPQGGSFPVWPRPPQTKIELHGNGGDPH